MHGVVGVSRAGRLFAGLLVALLGGALLVVGSPGLASATAGNDDNVTICHARSATNNAYGPAPQVVDPASIFKNNGHASHTGPVYADGMDSGWGDIIPPFDYDGGSFPGLNWDAAGQAIWNNECQVPQTPQPTETTVSAAPYATDPTCEAAGTLVISDQEGVEFAGADNGAGPGTYTVTASATDGYTLSGTTSWNITVLDKKSVLDCAGPQPEDTVVTRTKVTESCDKNIIVTDHYETWTRWSLSDAGQWVSTVEREEWAGKETQEKAFTAEECGYEPKLRDKFTWLCKDSALVTDHYRAEYTWSAIQKAWVLGAEKWVNKDVRAMTEQELIDHGCVTVDEQVIPQTPIVTEAQCTSNAATQPTVELPADSEGVSYAFAHNTPNAVGFVITATLASGHTWGDLAGTGWQLKSDGTAALHHQWTAAPDCRTEVTPVDPTVTVSTDCGVDDVLVVPDAGDGFSYREKWNADGTHVQVVADAADGYYFDTNGERKVIRTWEFDVRTVANGGINACVDEPVVPTVTVSTECGVADQLVVPADTDQVAYEVYPKPDNQMEIKARTKAGFEFANGKQLRQWTLTVNPAADCPVETSPVETSTVETSTVETSTVETSTVETSTVETSTVETSDTATTTPTQVLGSSIDPTSSASSEQSESSSADDVSSSGAAVPVASASVSPRVAGSSLPAAPVATAVASDPAAASAVTSAESQLPAPVAAQAGPPSATAHTGEGSGAMPYLLLAGGLLLMVSGLRARRRGNHAA